MVDPVLAGEMVSPAINDSPDALVFAYRHLCRRGARKFLRAGLERSDLEQIAAVGLIKAARRYDATCGTPFEAYAWTIVVGELMHYVRDYERAVRIPRRLQALEREYIRAHETLLGRLQREPSIAELARALRTSAEAVEEVRVLRSTSAPLPLDGRGAREMRDNDGTSVGPDDRIVIDAALRTLSRPERSVIAGVYMLGLTQSEIARRLALPAKRVSRMHRAALDRMQRACSS